MRAVREDALSLSPVLLLPVSHACRLVRGNAEFQRVCKRPFQPDKAHVMRPGLYGWYVFVRLHLCELLVAYFPRSRRHPTPS